MHGKKKTGGGEMPPPPPPMGLGLIVKDQIFLIHLLFKWSGGNECGLAPSSRIDFFVDMSDQISSQRRQLSTKQ